MAHSVKIIGATFTKMVSALPPYLSLSQMMLFMGGSQAASLKNYANTAAPATVVGTPVYEANYVTLSQANGFEAPMAAGRSPFTHVAVVTQSSGTCGYCGQWTGGGNTPNLIYRAAGDVTLSLDGGAGNVSTPMPSAGFQFIAGSHNSVTANVYRGLGGTLTKASVAYVGDSRTAKFRVGGHTLGSGTFNAAAVMTFNTMLSDAQIDEIYDYMVFVMAGRGITVA